MLQFKGIATEDCITAGCIDLVLAFPIRTAALGLQAQYYERLAVGRRSAGLRMRRI